MKQISLGLLVGSFLAINTGCGSKAALNDAGLTQHKNSSGVQALSSSDQGTVVSLRVWFEGDKPVAVGRSRSDQSMTQDAAKKYCSEKLHHPKYGQAQNHICQLVTSTNQRHTLSSEGEVYNYFAHHCHMTEMTNQGTCIRLENDFHTSSNLYDMFYFFRRSMNIFDAVPVTKSGDFIEEITQMTESELRSAILEREIRQFHNIYLKKERPSSYIVNQAVNQVLSGAKTLVQVRNEIKDSPEARRLTQEPFVEQYSASDLERLKKREGECLVSTDDGQKIITPGDGYVVRHETKRISFTPGSTYKNPSANYCIKERLYCHNGKVRKTEIAMIPTSVSGSNCSFETFSGEVEFAKTNLSYIKDLLIDVYSACLFRVPNASEFEREISSVVEGGETAYDNLVEVCGFNRSEPPVVVKPEPKPVVPPVTKPAPPVAQPVPPVVEKPVTTPKPAPQPPAASPDKSQTNEEKLAALYNQLLGRAPDSGGKSYYLGFIKRGVSFENVEKSIKRSAEYQIRRLYLDHLLREPDSGGFAHYRSQAKKGRSIESIKKEIQNASECKKDCL